MDSLASYSFFKRWNFIKLPEIFYFLIKSYLQATKAIHHFSDFHSKIAHFRSFSGLMGLVSGPQWRSGIRGTTRPGNVLMKLRRFKSIDLHSISALVKWFRSVFLNLKKFPIFEFFKIFAFILIHFWNHFEFTLIMTKFTFVCIFFISKIDYPE